MCRTRTVPLRSNMMTGRTCAFGVSMSTKLDRNEVLEDLTWRIAGLTAIAGQFGAEILQIFVPAVLARKVFSENQCLLSKSEKNTLGNPILY